jgi:choline transport protein
MGIFINIGAVAWLLMVWVFCFFPVAIPVTAATMNWNVVMFVGISVIGLGYWFIWGRKTYKPPVFLIARDS